MSETVSWKVVSFGSADSRNNDASCLRRGVGETDCMHLAHLGPVSTPQTDNSSASTESRSLQSPGLLFLTADNYLGLAVVVHILGGIMFVSLLFPTCMKGMTKGYVISVRDFICCVAFKMRHASCLSFPSSSPPEQICLLRTGSRWEGLETPNLSSIGLGCIGIKVLSGD